MEIRGETTMAQTSRPTLTLYDMSIIMLAFGFQDVDEFIRFVNKHEVRRMVGNNEKADAVTEDMYAAEERARQLRNGKISAAAQRPSMVYGSGRV
jgi:hypothetical protein